MEKRSLKQAKCLSDQLDEEIITTGELNNTHILIVKESDFLNLIDMIFSKINNLLEIFMDLDFVIFLNNKI